MDELRFIYPWILLHPNIPKPLHGVNPRTIMGKEWWDEQRQKAYARNNYHCWACGVYKYDAKYHQWLEAHEVYSYNYRKGTIKFEILSALCHACHNAIHTGRLEMMVLYGKVTEQFQREILEHKENVLGVLEDIQDEKIAQRLADWQWFTAGDLTEENHVGWSKWRLIFDGKEYKPIHESFEAWAAFYEKMNNGGGE